MLISDFTDAIGFDFRSLAQLGSPETVEVAERLALAAQPALRTRYLHALNLLIQEFNLREGTPLTLILEGDEVRLVRLVVPTGESVAAPRSDYSARIALRLGDELKEQIESLATEVGSSMNTWIVRSLERSVHDTTPDAPGRGTHRLRGKGRA